MTFEINETQGIQEQCDEMFVVANVEEVVSDNCVTEEDQSCQSSNVFLVSSVNSDCAESDEDIEVDIDGSDSEGDDNSLIPGNNNILKKKLITQTLAKVLWFSLIMPISMLETLILSETLKPS